MTRTKKAVIDALTDFTESAFQCQVCNALDDYEARGQLTYFGTGTGAKHSPRRAKQLVNQGHRKGAPDLVILTARKEWPGVRAPQGKGKTIFCELKTKTGKQSDEQITFENFCGDNDHVYVVIRSLDELHDLLKIHLGTARSAAA